MNAVTGGILLALAALSVTASEQNYFETCVTDPEVGVLHVTVRRPGRVKGHGKIKRCRIECSKEFSPVCGNDGTTYGNQCRLCSAACHDHSLYPACPGRCPCPGTGASAPDSSAGQDRGDTGVMTEEEAVPSSLPPVIMPGRDSDEQDERLPLDRSDKAGDGDRRVKPGKLKQAHSQVILVTSTDMDITSNAITADALNRVILDIHADLAPESNPVAEPSLWLVEVYYKGKGKSPKRGLVSQPLGPVRSCASSGRCANIRSVQYELDMRGKSCRDAAKLCVYIKHQKIGKRRAKIVGRPTAKALRSCAKLRCRSST